MTILERIKKVMKTELNQNFDDINEATTFEELSLDSLDLVGIIMAIEEEFEIEIGEDDGDNMKCIGDAVKYVADRID